MKQASRTNFIQRSALAALVALSITGVATAATKDVVLDRIVTPIYATAPMAVQPASDAMVVSVLVASYDGSLTPRSTNTLFRTGDRIHLKVLTSRDGAIEVYNTTPRGETSRTPIWKGEVRVGEELITPRLLLTGTSGEDQIHVVLTPSKPDVSIFDWLADILRGKGKSSRKDVVLDTQSTATSTYIVNTAGQGLTTTIRVAHN